jgi:hypothetical protein
MFNAEAEKIVDDIRRRFSALPDEPAAPTPTTDT